VSPRDAVPLSLFIVGAVALIGALQRARAGEIHWPAVLWFALSGMAGAALGAVFTERVPQEALMVSFAILMVDVDQAAAMERAEAIRTEISELGGVFRASGYQLSVSGGLTLLAPDDARPQELLLRAERALFLAQGNGHNQIALVLQDH
jgi:hypothetical protein